MVCKRRNQMTDAPRAFTCCDCSARIMLASDVELLLREAMLRLDMAFCIADDARLSKRFGETRDKIREALNNV